MKIVAKIKLSNVVMTLIGLFIALYLSLDITGLWNICSGDGELQYISKGNMRFQEDIKFDGQKYTIQDEEAVMYIFLNNPDYYKYLYFNFSMDSKGFGTAVLNIYDDLGNVIESYNLMSDNDRMCIDFSDTGFGYAEIAFTGLAGKSVYIDNFQFRTEPPFDKWGDFICYFCIIFFMYIIIIKLLKRKAAFVIKEKCKKLPEYIHYAYDKIVNMIFSKIPVSIYAYKVNLMLIVIVLLIAFYNMYKLIYDAEYNVFVMILSLGVLIITILLGSKKEEKVYWNNPLFVSWFVLSMMMIVSQVFVGQTKGMVGYFNLCILGIFYYVSGKKSNRKRILQCIKIAVLLTFIPCMVKCLFFYDIANGGIRFGGIYGNANQFAAYVIVVFSVLISDIDYYLEKGKMSVSLVLEGVLLGVAGCFLWLTQCRTTLLAMVLIVFFTVAKNIVMRDKYVNGKKRILLLLIVLVIIPIVWKGSIWSINNIALKNSEIKVMAENIIPGTIVAKAQSTENRILTTLKNASSIAAFSNGRMEYWIAHLLNMNILGHKDYLYIASLNAITPSHNSIIGMMYKYGIFTAIPYVIMLFYSVVFAIKYFLSASFKNKNAMLPLNITISFIMCSMLDTMDERPFWKMLWLLYYMIIGILMNNEVRDEGSYSVDNSIAIERQVQVKTSATKAVIVGGIIFIVVSVGYNIYEQVYSSNVIENGTNRISVPLRLLDNQNSENVENSDIYSDISGVKNSIIDSLKIVDDSIEEKIVYAAPYYYAFYISDKGENSDYIGIAVSENGIYWKKLCVSGTFKENNIERTDIKYDSKNNVILLEYLCNDSNTRIATFDVSQNRDMTAFNPEADWNNSLVSSDKVLEGSYAIEGEAGTKNVWVQKEASIDLYYGDDAQNLKISGYMPMEQYEKNGINEVTMKININGSVIAEKTFNASGLFEIQIPISSIEDLGEFMHIELTTDADFNPKKMGTSEDDRDLSYVLYKIVQE